MTNLSVSNVRELDFSDMNEYLYHGTYGFKDECDVATVENIDVKRGNKRVDFGQGFYVCTDREQAERRARLIYKRDNKDENNTMRAALAKSSIPIKISSVKVQEALVVRYKINPDKVLGEKKKKLFKMPDAEWFDFIFNNRKSSPEKSLEHNQDAKYSIVYGYMADGVFREIAELLKEKYGSLSRDEIKTIYECFTAKKTKIETQVSFHIKDVIKGCLNNGDIFPVKM